MKNMLRGTALTDIVKTKIIALKDSGSSGREIARQIVRSRYPKFSKRSCFLWLYKENRTQTVPK